MNFGGWFLAWTAGAALAAAAFILAGTSIAYAQGSEPSALDFGAIVGLSAMAFGNLYLIKGDGRKK